MTTIFERCAVRACEILVKEKLTTDPRAAWKIAISSFTSSKETQGKGCPATTFYGLWYAGIIKGSVPQQNYDIPRNAQYAIDGIKELKTNPNLSKPQVWDRVRVGGAKNSNGQMDVLFALRQRGLIVGLP